MHTILAKAVTPIVWRIPGHDARKLFGFAQAEQASMLDLKEAIRLTPSVQRKAAYMRHMLDEARHAQMFTLRSAELCRSAGKDPYGQPRPDTEHLFSSLDEIQFLAFVHRGERRGCEQFEAYRNWFARQGDDKSRALFDAILKDERRHMSYTMDLLVEMTGSEASARVELRKAALWEAWRTWRRAGRFIAEKVYFVLMMSLYILLPPYALLMRVVDRKSKGWSTSTREIEVSHQKLGRHSATAPH